MQSQLRRLRERMRKRKRANASRSFAVEVLAAPKTKQKMKRKMKSTSQNPRRNRRQWEKCPNNRSRKILLGRLRFLVKSKKSGKRPFGSLMKRST
jgi:hypothetical protein